MRIQLSSGIEFDEVEKRCSSLLKFRVPKVQQQSELSLVTMEVHRHRICITQLSLFIYPCQLIQNNCLVSE